MRTRMYGGVGAGAGPSGQSPATRLESLVSVYLHVFVVVFAITSVDLSEHSTWATDSNNIGWDALRHDRTSSDNGVLTDRDTGKNNGTSTDPHVALDNDRKIELQGQVEPAQLGSDGVRCGRS